jgi:hypothetical protein
MVTAVALVGVDAVVGELHAVRERLDAMERGDERLKSR